MQERDYDFADKLVFLIADWLDKDSDNELKFRKDTANKRYNFEWSTLAVLLQTTIFPSANNKYGLTPRDIEKLQKRPSVIEWHLGISGSKHNALETVYTLYAIKRKTTRPMPCKTVWTPHISTGTPSRSRTNKCHTIGTINGSTDKSPYSPSSPTYSPTHGNEISVPQECPTLEEAVERITHSSILDTIVLSEGTHDGGDKYRVRVTISSAMKIIGRGLKSNILVLGGFDIKPNVQGMVDIENITIRNKKGSGVYGGSSFNLTNVFIEKCKESGVFAMVLPLMVNVQMFKYPNVTWSGMVAV